jgi:hypothetical protein
MCCLKYEQAAYVDLHKNTPPPGCRVKTPHGDGIVTDVNLLRERVKVLLDQGDNDVRQYSCCDVCKINKGHGKAQDFRPQYDRRQNERRKNPSDASVPNERRKNDRRSK